MSFSISWIAVKGLNRQAILSALGLKESGRAGNRDRARFSCAKVRGGWTLIYATEFDFASPERLSALSTGGGRRCPARSRSMS